jgi:hypothetical protein
LIGKALSSPGIESNEKTHINFGSSARMTDIVDANEDQRRRQGRWNGAYLTSLSREMMRLMAGFPTGSLSFYLARDHDTQEDFI